MHFLIVLHQSGHESSSLYSFGLCIRFAELDLSVIEFSVLGRIEESYRSDLVAVFIYLEDVSVGSVKIFFVCFDETSVDDLLLQKHLPVWLPD